MSIQSRDPNQDMARILSTPTKQHPPTIRAPILTPRDVKLTRDTKTFPGVVIIVAIIIGCFVLALFCGLLINHMRKVRKGREEHARREVRRGCAPPGLESPVAKCVVKMNRFKPIRPIRLEELQKPAPAVRSRDCHIMRMWAGDRNAQDDGYDGDYSDHHPDHIKEPLGIVIPPREEGLPPATKKTKIRSLRSNSTTDGDYRTESSAPSITSSSGYESGVEHSAYLSSSEASNSGSQPDVAAKKEKIVAFSDANQVLPRYESYDRSWWEPSVSPPPVTSGMNDSLARRRSSQAMWQGVSPVDVDKMMEEFEDKEMKEAMVQVEEHNETDD